jgi:biopolymer transport protein ExbD
MLLKTMNIPRLRIATLLLSLAIASGGAASALPQPVQTKPKPLKDSAPPEPSPTDPAPVKPHPLTLVVGIDLAGKVTLNLEPAGSTDNTRPLVKRLRRIFAERTRNRVYEPGGEKEMRIAKLVYITAPESAKYVAVVRVINAIKLAGGNPIGLQIDDTK